MKQQRIPRPKGTTEISQYLNHSHPLEESEPNNKELINHIINHYINTGYTYCHTPMDIVTFSNYTGIEEKDIHEVIIGNAKDMGNKMDKEHMEGIMAGLLFSVLGGALNDRQTALYHQQILLNSQGATYKPFISGEVTKALKLSQDSNAQLAQLVKMIMPNKGPNILNQFNTQNIYSSGDSGDMVNGDNGLSVQDALLLIQQSDSYMPLLSDESQKDRLALEHLSEPVPEVRAIYQQGINTDKEGLNFGKIAELSEGLLIDDDSHIDRRAKELEIDLESDEI